MYKVSSLPMTLKMVMLAGLWCLSGLQKAGRRGSPLCPKEVSLILRGSSQRPHAKWSLSCVSQEKMISSFFISIEHLFFLYNKANNSKKSHCFVIESFHYPSTMLKSTVGVSFLLCSTPARKVSFFPLYRWKNWARIGIQAVTAKIVVLTTLFSHLICSWVVCDFCLPALWGSSSSRYYCDPFYPMGVFCILSSQQK